MEIAVFLALILDVVKFIAVGYVLFEKKISRRYVVGITVFAANIIVAGNFAQNLEEAAWISMLFVIAGLLLMVDLPIIERVGYALKVVFIATCMDYVVGTALEMTEIKKLSEEEQWIIGNIISLLLYAFIYLIRRVQNKNGWKMQLLGKCVLYGTIVIMAIAMPLTISGLKYFAQREQNPELMNGIQMLSTVAMLGVVMLVVSVIYISDANKKIQKYLETEKILKETQKNYYEAMLQKEEATRRFRHDVSNHMMCIRELAEEQEMQQVRDYVDEIQGEMVKIQQRCYSVGNAVVNAVLNYYVQLLKEDVEIKVSGALTEEIDISDVELCTIFSNIMKNASEALGKQQGQEKYLQVKVHTGEKDIIMEVENSRQEEKRETVNGLPMTTKVDKKSHGIGLKNVKEIVEKNKGMFRWEMTGKVFRVKVILPLRSRG